MTPLHKDYLRLAGSILIGLGLAALLCLCSKCCAAEAALHIERRGGDVILYITGGTSNVQYQIWTAPNPDHNVASTNWYYWRWIYSRDFVAQPGYGEVLVYGTNTSQQPRRFFQIRGVLPDPAQAVQSKGKADE